MSSSMTDSSPAVGGGIALSLYEQHPGFGEWGMAVAVERGFTLDAGGPADFLRASLTLPARPEKDDHLVVNGDEYVVSYVLWRADGACWVFARWNGRRP